MSDFLFFFAYFCVTGVFVFIAILMLIGTEKAIGLLYRSLSVFYRGPVKVRESFSFTPSERLGWRVAGFFATLFALFMLLGPIYWMVKGPSGPSVTPKPETPTETLQSWEAIQNWVVVGIVLVFCLFGLAVVFKPQSIISWFQNRMPELEWPELTSHEWSRGRWFGVLMILASLYLLFGVFRHR